MEKQVSKNHYNFFSYLHKQRWASIWHQIDEILKLSPDLVLEIGPGPGIFKALAQALGVGIETLDLDPDLNPDHIGSVLNMPFNDESFDVVCAFQMLEHLPYEKSVRAFAEMARVSKHNIVISLPDAAIRYSYSAQIPRIGMVNFSLPKPRLSIPPHQFDGEHYWEINKSGFPLHKVISDLKLAGKVDLMKTYRVPEYQYHRFFVFGKDSEIVGSCAR